ncbi:hypothetical protein [Paractinoplanes globisporus]|uniref:RNA polymerase sigma-70 region 2 domain-containing protein n=1 Tax=Paractinoplanes globisporus TaxID=113565 RepID=A0ABW6WSG6_9ACTN|nr:hypothetical protein [Actinoplanes globisporus]
MSALNHHDPCRRAHESGPRGGPERLRWLVRRIAGDDRGAFAELFDRCAGPVLSGLCAQVSDPRRVAGVLAGTFVEVWWLAGCHTDPGTDVMAWIDGIVRRRVADTRPAEPADPAASGVDPFGALWAQGVEVELACLLRRRLSRPAWG